MAFLNKSAVLQFFDRIVYAIGFLSFFVFLLRIGFHLSDTLSLIVVNAIQVIVAVFCIQEILRWVLASSVIEHLRLRWFENFIVIVLGFYFFKGELIHSSVQKLHPELGIDDVTVAYLGITSLALLFGESIRLFRSVNIFSRYSLTTSQIFAISFAVPIFIGTLLLKMPKATTHGISWLDAFFTSTSAVCVTGLTVLNTAEGFTPLGQFIIFLLFQIGGLGIMTLSLAFGLLFSGGLGLKERILMKDIISADRMGEIGSILAKITAFTLSVEAVGACFLYISKGYSFQALDIKELYFAIFHAVSAFCNAGFSLYTDGLAANIVATNTFYGFSIMALVLLGGLGFPVVINLYEALWPKKRVISTIKISTRLILSSTLIFAVLGVALIFLLERNQSFAGLSFLDQLYQSSFLSVAARTAGFNIWATESLSISTGLIIILLMWIGGSPMSTAGGIKNLTAAVAFLAIKAMITGSKKVECFGRQIATSSIIKAFNIIVISMLVLFFSTICLILLEPQAKAFDLFFEAVSAFCTVGLSRGVTPGLSDPSKLIIITLMYTGRIGFITILSSFFIQAKNSKYKLLDEHIVIN